MFYQDLHAYIRNTSEEYDVLAKITQHPGRPKPLRVVDQIYMLPGSQLNQAKLVSDYLRGREVVFVGDGDCMSLVTGILGKEKLVDPPAYMRVFDFDERIVKFVRDASQQFGFSDLIEAHYYNVRKPVPKAFFNQSDVFYTNPPYGSKNGGQSGIVFLARCMEFCKSAGSYGVAILPFHHHKAWSRDAMYNIQQFLNQNGYVVSEMLRGMHRYHLDDEPELLSGTVIMDRVKALPPPYRKHIFKKEELRKFYGDSQKEFPDRIDENGIVVAQ
ncbi:MAG: bis-aminopropyl spermidine synthase family protein [Acidobacteriia bacterium]|nr:bis-aminopropyl spermidine synthase family protein [Terriglobia bacterium]